MDLNFILPAAVALNTLISCATAVYALLTASSKKTAANLTALEQHVNESLARLRGDLVDHDRRVQSLESDMRHLPDREHAHRMELALEKLTGVTKTLESQLSGRMDALDERLKPVSALGVRLQEFLIEQAKGK